MVPGTIVYPFDKKVYQVPGTIVYLEGKVWPCVEYPIDTVKGRARV